jgi:hypothetical protein
LSVEQPVAVFGVFPVWFWMELFSPVFPQLFFPVPDWDWAFAPVRRQ